MARTRTGGKAADENPMAEALDRAGRGLVAIRKIGVSSNTLSKWRKDKLVKHPAAAGLLRLCEAAEPSDPVKRWKLARRLAGME